ncbi:fructokinase [Chitiniphilus shinanonensis]|uniref:Fructokinase n=1 Tax=Chitiniphilus shinanonensis TaxID=553088 RepID=A0ABQ6BNE9_9NEIS|nr:carbohydrate kinase [Chitiniphilus shinanonensis]GLS03535.1 fructokinase [Chitiniphilus shinanonensis]
MSTRFVVFGEALTDFIREEGAHWRAVAGGSCWNVARVGARLGVGTGFAGAVSRDVFGDELAQLSADAGLDLRFLQRLDKSPFLAIVPSKHPPSYFFVGDDSADLHFDPERLPQGWLDAAQTVHFGSISLVRQPLAARLLTLARQVKAAGRAICFDPNHRDLMDQRYTPTLQAMAGLADYIKVSDEDLAKLFPAQDAAQALATLRGWAPDAQILFTRGGDGMTLLTPQGDHSRPVFPVQVADTVGAGDASMGGWMTSLLTRPDATPAAHLDFAAATAALACTHHGAYAPTREEVERLLG